MLSNIDKCLNLAKKLGYTPVLNDEKTNAGSFNGGTKFLYNSKASPGVILHEIGHCLLGYGCCREHDEFLAQGVAIGLAIRTGIEIDIEHEKYMIQSYSGRSSREACGAYEQTVKKGFLQRLMRVIEKIVSWLRNWIYYKDRNVFCPFDF